MNREQADPALRKTASEYYEKAEKEYRELHIDRALDYYKKSYDAFEKLEDTERIADITEIITEIYSMMSRAKDSVDICLHSLDVCEKFGDRKSYARVLFRLSDAYYMENEFEKTDDTLKKSLVILEDLKEYELLGEKLIKFVFLQFIVPDPESILNSYRSFLKENEEINSDYFNAVMYTCIGSAYFRKGDISSALEYYTQARSLIGDETTPTSQWLFLGIGKTLESLGDLEGAKEAYHEALNRARTDPINYPVELMAESSIILLLSDILDDLDGILPHIERKMDIAEAFHNEEFIASAFQDLGIVYYRLQKDDSYLDIAEEYFKKSLNMYRELDIPESVIKLLLHLIVICIDKGELQTTAKYRDEVMEILPLINDEKIRVTALRVLGTSYVYIGRWKEATDYLKSAYDFYEKRNDFSNMAECMFYMGEITKRITHDFDTSIRYYIKAAGLFKNTRRKNMVGQCFMGIGGIYEEQWQMEKAEKYYRMALNVFEQLDNEIERGTAFLNIGKTYLGRDDVKRAMEYFGKAYDIYREKNDVKNMMMAKSHLATAEYMIDLDEEKFIKSYTEVIDVLIREKEWYYVKKVLKTFGEALVTFGRYEDAINVFKKKYEVEKEQGFEMDANETEQRIEEIEEMIG